MKEEPTFTLAECQAEYLCGVETGKKMMGQGMIPETLQFNIRVMDKSGEIEAISQTISFESIRYASSNILNKELQYTLGKIAAQGILKKLIES